MLFSTAARPFLIPTGGRGGSDLSTSWPAPVIRFLTFAISHPNGYAHLLTFEKRTFTSEPLDYKVWLQLVIF